jgi:site-specific recombinase XerD
MTAPAVQLTVKAPTPGEVQWEQIASTAPGLAATSARYLAQISLSLRPSSVAVAELALRAFCCYLIDEHPEVTAFNTVGRAEIEGFKKYLATRPSAKGVPRAVNTRLSRLGMLRSFFDRIIEWEWDDAPPRGPIFASDLPKADDPLPKFLDDADATRLARAIAAEPDARTRLVLELLMRTGMRVSEMCALETDAVIRIGDGWWLRVPVGKLHNDRYVPLHPVLVSLLEQWQNTHGDNTSGLLIFDQASALNRHAVTRMLDRVAKQAGLGHIHPHRLRHTLGTQAVNRGMRLEAVAALLGHQTLQMTARYARIANRTVAAEYQAVTAKVEALYNQPGPLNAELEGPAMRKVRAEHRRMLANGWCTRPAELDCNFEAICEGCGFFATTIEFKQTLTAQADHAARHGQHRRQTLYEGLLETLEAAES